MKRNVAVTPHANGDNLRRRHLSALRFGDGSLRKLDEICSGARNRIRVSPHADANQKYGVASVIECALLQGCRLAMVQYPDNYAHARNILKSPVRLTDGQNLRGAEAADAFELPQMREITRKCSAHPFEDA